MNRYSNEDARNLVKLEIKNRKEALNLYPEIIKVVEQFDGKVLNKRLETALKKVDERISCDRGFYHFEIVFNTINSRSCRSVTSPGTCNYIEDYCFVLNSYLDTYFISASGKDRMEESFLVNEKIRASVLVDSLLKGKAYLEDQITKLEQSLEKIDELKSKIEQLETEIKSIKEEIPYLVRVYYGIG